MINRERKTELLQRTLGLKHKIKVHESMRPPDNHEEIALFTLAKWDLEDELKAIEELLEDSRLESVKSKKQVIIKEGPHTKARPQKKK